MALGDDILLAPLPEVDTSDLETFIDEFDAIFGIESEEPFAPGSFYDVTFVELLRRINELRGRGGPNLDTPDTAEGEPLLAPLPGVDTTELEAAYDLFTEQFGLNTPSGQSGLPPAVQAAIDRTTEIKEGPTIEVGEDEGISFDLGEEEVNDPEKDLTGMLDDLDAEEIEPKSSVLDLLKAIGTGALVAGLPGALLGGLAQTFLGDLSIEDIGGMLSNLEGSEGFEDIDPFRDTTGLLGLGDKIFLRDFLSQGGLPPGGAGPIGREDVFPGPGLGGGSQGPGTGTETPDITIDTPDITSAGIGADLRTRRQAKARNGLFGLRTSQQPLGLPDVFRPELTLGS